MSTIISWAPFGSFVDSPNCKDYSGFPCRDSLARPACGPAGPEDSWCLLPADIGHQVNAMAAL